MERVGSRTHGADHASDMLLQVDKEYEYETIIVVIIQAPYSTWARGVRQGSNAMLSASRVSGL